MNSITFNCRFITPAFIGGADPKGTPELRPPSLKGALRFWWRAMNGQLVHVENNKPFYFNLLKNDELNFGGINQLMHKSPIIIRMVEKKIVYIKGGDVFQSGKSGLDYLLYTMKHHRKDDLGFDKDSEFDIIFSSRGINRNEMLKAIASFWLLVNLGSLGTRARRGAGSFCIDSIEDKNDILDNQIAFCPEINESIFDFLSTNFKKIQKMIGSSDPVTIKGYSMLNQINPAYLSSESFSTWQDAVNSIGMELLSIRKGKSSRNKSERTFTMESLNKKAAFGIPVGVRDDNSVTLEKNERRASPVYLSVVFNINTQKYHWTVTHLEGIFMPDGDKILFASKNRNVRKKDYNWHAEDDSLVKSFMQKIKNKAQKI